MSYDDLTNPPEHEDVYADSGNSPPVVQAPSIVLLANTGGSIPTATTARTRLVLRPYQTTALDQVAYHFAKGEREVVLAASCGAGKTCMAIRVIEDFLVAYPDKRVLVLTHGQHILRTQFAGEMEQHANFTYAVVESGRDLGRTTAPVVVTLPQTIYRQQTLPEFDLIVVDEAHQLYCAETMVRRIVKETSPSRILLLTGTPSPFVGRMCPIVSVTMTELLAQKAVSDFTVEIATTTYAIKDTDYTQDENLRKGFEFSQKATDATLHDVLHKLHDRLVSPPSYAGPLRKVVNWFGFFRTLGKTMIACHAQEQARQVKAFFTKKGITTALCTSEDDPDSETIEAFRSDPACRVLIVVYRGVLGFSYPNLVNVVDMTCSRNPNRIFQLAARLTRPHPNGDRKLFVKVVPNAMASYFRHIITATLSLASNPWYSQYNGTNFLDLALLVQQPKHQPSSDNTPRSPSRKKRMVPQPPRFEGLPIIEFMRDLHRTGGETLTGYCYTTLRKVRAALLGVRILDPDGNKAAIRAFVRQYGRTPSYNSKDTEERRLGKLIGSYCSPSSRGYDSDFAKEMAPYRCFGDSSGCKEDIRAFVRQHGRVPSRYNKNPDERRLAWRTLSYSSPSSESYDEAFAKEIAPYRRTYKTEQRKAAVRAFVGDHGRAPNHRSTNTGERKLGTYVIRYCCPSSGPYDETFAKEMAPYRLCYDSDAKKVQIRKFVQEHGRLPRVGSRNPEERKLGKAMGWYCGPSSDTYDDAFAKEMAPYRRNVSARKKAAIRAFLQKHGRLPSRSSKDLEEQRLAQRLSEYCGPSKGTYDEAFAKEMAPYRRPRVKR